MTQARKNFIHRNEGFICLHCGVENGPLEGSCRNHCRWCLYSRHVDADVPGDRASTCLGLMRPMALDIPKKKAQMIVHRCLTCQKEIRNMVAPDDDLEALIMLGKHPYPSHD